MINNVLPKIKLNLEGTTNFSKLFKSNIKELWIEVGFGSGEHLKWQLENNKDIAIIGCEPYVNGIANLLELLSEEELQRIKIYDGDVRKVFNKMEVNSISKVFILFPDPKPQAVLEKSPKASTEIMHDSLNGETLNAEDK